MFVILIKLKKLEEDQVPNNKNNNNKIFEIDKRPYSDKILIL
jgi:hypothetical protein